MTYSHTAKAKFTVASWSEKVVADIDGSGSEVSGTYYPDRGISQAAVNYAYSGDIEGTGELVYLITYKSDTAPSLGFERFTGSIGGHEGSCVFQHIGDHDAEAVSARVEVVPGLGTGGLENLRGAADVTLAGHSDDGYEFVFTYDLD